jgi:tetratricopeptide (TPR) repeat protein
LELQIKVLTLELKEQPTNAGLYLRRGDVHRQHGDYAAALNDIAKAQQLNPRLLTAIIAQAQTLFDANQVQEAKGVVEKFLTKEPSHATALALLGHCEQKLGNPRRAITQYSAALNAFAQPTPELYTERARLQASMGRFDEAIAGLDEGMRRMGTSPTLQMTAIEYERQRGNFDGALRRVEQMVGTTRLADTLLLRARLLEQAGCLNEAQNAFQEALAASHSTGLRQTESLSATRNGAAEGLARVEARRLRLAVQDSDPSGILQHQQLQ